MAELPEEKYVRELFFKTYGVTLDKIREDPKAKTPDYWVLDADGKHAAALEVTRFGAVPSTEENGWRQSGPFMTRTDNAADRVAAAIHAKVKQLRTHSGVRVLVFVNDSNFMDAKDFQSATKGYLIYGDDESGRFKSNTPMTKSVGRIREEKFEIDVYAWINRYEGLQGSGLRSGPHRELGPFICLTSEAGHEMAQRVLGLPARPKPTVDPDADVPTMHEMLLREAGILPPKKGSGSGSE